MFPSGYATAIPMQHIYDHYSNCVRHYSVLYFQSTVITGCKAVYQYANSGWISHYE